MQELEIVRLQAALQALTEAPNANNQHPAGGSEPHVIDTGVFSSVSHSSARGSIDSSAAEAVPASLTASGNDPHDSGHPAAVAGQLQLFLYPEDTQVPLQKALQNHQEPQLTKTAHTTGMQQHQQQQGCMPQPHSPAVNGHTGQVYTVEEPDSPVHGLTAEQDSSKGPMQQSEQRVRHHEHAVDDLPAGCLYQDTTIRRTTTPSGKGQAWTHHEEITVREIREIRRSEAHMVPLPAINRPHVTEGQPLQCCCA